MIVMGQCKQCDHEQPGRWTGTEVRPLAEDGCANCDGRAFRVADDEDVARTPFDRSRATAGRSGATPSRSD